MKRFWAEIKLNWKIATLTLVSTTVLLADSYHHSVHNRWAEGVVFYLAIPLFVIWFIFREPPKDYGVTLGDWKVGILLTLGCIALITPVLWFLVGGDQSMQRYYADKLDGLPWNTFLDLLSWEFIFRGWLLFGYARKFGPEALWLQAVPFAMAHMGKPEVETLSTIFGGFVFGWVAYRSKSFIYPFLIHWYIASLTIILAANAVR